MISNQAERALQELLPHYTETLEKLDAVHDELQSLNGIHRRGAIARSILVGAGPVTQKLSVSAGRLAGYSIRETAGAVAVVRLRDGVDAGGDLIAPIALAANASSAWWFMPHGISFGAGLFLEVVAGAVEGAVYTV